jgi:hypothetical protein
MPQVGTVSLYLCRIIQSIIFSLKIQKNGKTRFSECFAQETDSERGMGKHFLQLPTYREDADATFN